jgi:phosphoribosylaminoimidazolecarboxamide formyltransferase/IMP cyclohydrolase
MNAVSRALLSVSDKTGLVEFGKGLAGLGVELLATGGTADALEKAGCKVTRTESLTGFAELLDGRVKTLHPAIHGGILARRDSQSHLDQLKAAGYGPIDLVVVNLYPFERTVAKTGVSLEEAIEQIDIGGVALLRSAAKNHGAVAVVANPADYGTVLDELKAGGRSLSDATRQLLAVKAFLATAGYDAAISGWLGTRFGGEALPEHLRLAFRRKQVLRYGENPHQHAALYLDQPERPGSLASARLLNGKELSHNNLIDFDSALALASEFGDPACAVIKHRNPCGCAVATSLDEAVLRAVAADSLSAFGGMVAVNREVDELAAKGILKALESAKKFDGIVAPSFTPEAVKLLAAKPSPFPGKNMILLSLDAKPGAPRAPFTMRSIDGGLLVQDADLKRVAPTDLKVVTKRAPTEDEIEELLFAWTVSKHTVSNAIVLTKEWVTVGVGSGQVNRVGSVIIAARQAGDKAKGSALGSDAFFPYPDGVEEAGKAGVSCIIQPGGSMRDAETIAMADKYGMAMVMTGIRHFKH